MTADRTALLDVNVLVALFDGAHTHHENAHAWFAARRTHGWATTPLVENGLVRVLSHPAYPGRRTTLVDAVAKLREFRSSGHHTFWPEDLSLTDASRFAARHVAGHQQITDVYLLGLAVARNAALATFDRRIALESVRGARPEHLVLID